MSSNTKGFTVNLTNTIELPELKYVNELAREKNFEFGGGFSKVPPILEDLYYLYYQEREEGNDFDVKTHLFSPSIVEETLGRTMSESEKSYYGYTMKFLEDLTYADCPGYSPMDKALNTIMYLTYLSEKNNKETNDPNPKGNKSLTPESLAQAISDLSGGIPEGDDEGKSKKQDAGLTKDVISCVRDHLYDLSPSIANIYSQDKVADVPINSAILRDIKIKAYLEEKVGLETALDKKLVEDNRSKQRKNKQMTAYSQMTKSSKTAMVIPNFDDKMAKKELIIKEKVKPETKKQMLTMLLDDSGSMGSVLKQSYVRAVLLNRLESVIDGKSKLNFYLYESQRYGYKEVKDLKDAQDLFKSISLRSPRGGGTNIGRILQETIDEIHNVPGYSHPEIVIVNDGDDFVDLNAIDLKGVRVNAIMLGCENPNLKKLCELAGGFAIIEKMYDRY